MGSDNRILAFFHKARYQIIVWILVLVYFSIAPSWHARFLLHEGNPMQYDFQSDMVNPNIIYSVDHLDTAVVNDERLFKLWGWSFVSDNAEKSGVERIIMLQSESRIYFFPITNYERPDLNQAFPDIQFDISNCGFFTYIAKNAIQPGTYQIGIIYQEQNSDETFYIMTNKVLIRTPNNIYLEAVPVQP